MAARVRDIVEFFPSKWEARPSQVDVLKQVQAAWDKTDVIVIVAPTAFGKLALAQTILRWCEHKKLTSAYLNPTNVLLDQYKAQFPGYVTLYAKHKYSCLKYTTDQDPPVPMTVARVRDLSTQKGSGCVCDCGVKCPYTKDLRACYARKFVACNYHTYLAHRLKRDVLIMDEGHKVIGVLQGLAGKKYWYKDWHFPTWVNSYSSLERWLEKHPQLPTSPKLRSLLEELKSGREHYLITKEEEEYRDRLEWCLRLYPLNVTEQAPILFDTAKKHVLMSATISTKDLEECGLIGKRVLVINAESPIPVDRRPIYPMEIGAFNYGNLDHHLPTMLEAIKWISEEHGGSGFIHAPYSLAAKLLPGLAGVFGSSLITHGREDRTVKLEEFKRRAQAQESVVMLASGLEEGIDLKEDLARWQVLTKVPFMSLGEVAVKHRCETDPEWYAWEAAKLVQQAAGRVCRGPEDFGATYVLDSNFNRQMSRFPHLFFKWFKDAVATDDN